MDKAHSLSPLLCLEKYRRSCTRTHTHTPCWWKGREEAIESIMLNENYKTLFIWKINLVHSHVVLLLLLLLSVHGDDDSSSSSRATGYVCVCVLVSALKSRCCYFQNECQFHISTELFSFIWFRFSGGNMWIYNHLMAASLTLFGCKHGNCHLSQ